MTAHYTRVSHIVLRQGCTTFLSTLTYTTEDPLAVTLTIALGGLALATNEPKVRVWAFDRDLLLVGLTGPVGSGDIRIRPSSAEPSRLLIRLVSPSGDSTFSTAKAIVDQFATAIFRAVPPGTEDAWLDLDDTISKLLEAEA